MGPKPNLQKQCRQRSLASIPAPQLYSPASTENYFLDYYLILHL